jgi:hypothetical protein
VVRAQRDGSLARTAPTDAFARFATMLATGALVLRTLGVEPPDPDEWHALIAQLLDALAPHVLAPMPATAAIAAQEQHHD